MIFKENIAIAQGFEKVWERREVDSRKCNRYYEPLYDNILSLSIKPVSDQISVNAKQRYSEGYEM